MTIPLGRNNGRGRRARAAYSRVESQTEEGASEETTTSSSNTNNNNNNNNNNTEEEEESLTTTSNIDNEVETQQQDQQQQQQHQSSLVESSSASPVELNKAIRVDDEEDDDDDDNKYPKNEYITVVILDSAHNKFKINVHPDWTVQKLKVKGSKVHKCAPKSQRLIYLGKMLDDDSKTLREYQVTKNNKIIHLFPKPNVTIISSSQHEEEKSQSTEDDDNDDANDNNAGAAHVPQIILDADEAERRSQILVLSSEEIFEAQHRVKLLSFLLLIVCAMELLTLLTVWLGPVPSTDSSSDDDVPPGDPTDWGGSSSHNSNSGETEEFRTWQNTDYVDVAISAFGFWVATLGIKAATENTIRLAKLYMYCLFVTGVAWNAFYYYLNVQAEEEMNNEHQHQNNDQHNSTSTSTNNNIDDDFNNYYGEEQYEQQQQLSNSDIYTGAFFAILLPILVWVLCCLRAYQFHSLLREAEREAEERTRNELSTFGDIESGNNNNDDDEEEREQPQQQQQQQVIIHDQELSLQVNDDDNHSRRQIT